MKEKIEHITSGGHKIEILPVPPFLLDRVLGQVNYPEKPTYKTITASGEEEIFPHDETTLSTPEDKAAWEQYQRDLEAAKIRENETLLNVMLLKGIDVDMNDQKFKDWLEEQEFLGIELPTSKPALKVEYISTEVLGNVDDLSEIMALIMKQSGVAAEVVDQAIDSFQGAVAGAAVGKPKSQAG